MQVPERAQVQGRVGAHGCTWHRFELLSTRYCPLPTACHSTFSRSRCSCVGVRAVVLASVVLRNWSEWFCLRQTNRVQRDVISQLKHHVAIQTSEPEAADNERFLSAIKATVTCVACKYVMADPISAPSGHSFCKCCFQELARGGSDGPYLRPYVEEASPPEYFSNQGGAGWGGALGGL